MIIVDNNGFYNYSHLFLACIRSFIYFKTFSDKAVPPWFLCYVHYVAELFVNNGEYGGAVEKLHVFTQK